MGILRRSDEGDGGEGPAEDVQQDFTEDEGDEARAGSAAATGGADDAPEAQAEAPQDRSESAAQRTAPGADGDEGDGSGSTFVSEDGALLGRDFLIPGVDPEDDDPYRWH